MFILCCQKIGWVESFRSEMEYSVRYIFLFNSKVRHEHNFLFFFFADFRVFIFSSFFFP